MSGDLPTDLASCTVDNRAEQIVTGKSATKIVPSSIRRLTDKGNSTVTRILEEAKNILVKDRFLGLSFRAIAKRTGTTVGNIGYYYGTKDDLMVDLAEYIFDKWELRLQRDMPPAMSDQREKFRYFIRYMIDQNKQRKTMFLLLEMWGDVEPQPGGLQDDGHLLWQAARFDRGNDRGSQSENGRRHERAQGRSHHDANRRSDDPDRAPQAQAPRVGRDRARGHGPDREHGAEIVSDRAQRRCMRRSTASNSIFAVAANANSSSVNAMISRTLCASMARISMKPRP